MPTGIVFDNDEMVANWLFACHGQRRYSYDRALGLVRDGQLCGAVLFQNWNDHNVEISYYGKNTLTPGIIRCLMIFTLKEFDASRLTAMVPKRAKQWIKALLKLGFKVEGTARCYYGKEDCNRNTATRLVMFRSTIEAMAGSPIERSRLRC